MPGRVRSMVLGPAVALEARMAARSEPGTPSAWVVTLKMAGASRSSRLSRVSRHRAGALRIVREANRLPSQEWMVMECLLPEKAGPQGKKGTARPAPTEGQAGKALITAIAPPPLLSSMRNQEGNYARNCLAVSGRGTRRLGAAACGRATAGRSGAAPQLRLAELIRLPPQRAVGHGRGRAQGAHGVIPGPGGERRVPCNPGRPRRPGQGAGLQDDAG